MSQPESNNAWIDQLAVIGIGLSLLLLMTLSNAVPWWLGGGLVIVGLLWGLYRWWRR